jgi:CheY-like chemotaxis protein
VVRRAIPSAFSPKLGLFTIREERSGPSIHGVQPGQDGLALLLTMPDQPSSALPSGPELASEADRRDHSSNDSRLVLLIDDDEVVVRLLERALSSENYRSLSVSAGGLDLSALEERPFAIVVDITVPDVDGFEIVPRLRQHPLAQGVPIVMMSTRSGLKDRRSERGLQNFLTKPFRPSQLLQMLRKFAKDAETDQSP